MKSQFGPITIVYYLLLAIAVPTAACANGFSGGITTSATMHNGLKVIVHEDHSADLVALDVWVRAGSINETAKNNGVAHFLEHLLFKGTAKRPLGQADREIESLGATLDASTSHEAIRINTVVASRYFDTALDVITDVTMRAKLDPANIQLERMVILDEISRRDADPLQRLAALVNRMSFPDHPYGYPIEGPGANVAALSAEQIREYYEAYFVPNNMTVIVVGDINTAKAIDEVNEAFREFKKKDVPAAKPAPAPPLTESSEEKITAGSKLYYSAVSFAGPSIKETADVYAADVLIQYLVIGFNSWMETTLKNSKSGVQVMSGEYLTRREPGNIMLMFGCEPGGAPEVRQTIFAKLNEMKTTPLPEAEVARAGRSVEGNFAFDTETFSGRAHSLGFYESTGDYKFALGYAGNIRKVTPEQIRLLVEKFINTEACVIAEVGP